MKHKLLKMNSRGVSHVIALMLIIVGAGIVGSYLLVASHASTTPPIAYYKVTNTSPLTETAATYDLATAQSTNLQNVSSGSLTPAMYSPDHAYLAWGRTVYVNGQSQTTVYVKNVSAGTKTAIQLPAGQYFDNFAPYIQWYPGSKKLAFVTTAYINNAYQSYLHTVGVGGSGLTTVGLVNASRISSLAVSGDAKSLVFADQYSSTSGDRGVYSIVPGSSPVAIKTADGCGMVRALRDGSNDVVYSCAIPGGVGIYRSTPGSSNATLVHSYPQDYTLNGVSYVINDMTPSPDGKTLAVLDHKYTDVDPSNCQLTVQLQISTMPIVQNGTLASLHNGAVSQPGGGCKGGGGGDSSLLQWSPDSSSLAFLKDQAFNQPAGSSLVLLNISAKTTKQLLPAPVGAISW